MVDIEKIIKGTDLVLNCIPVVNTINNAAQAVYYLACRVNTLNPVAPGPITSIKIHVLSKDAFDYFVEAIPIFGNLIALAKLVISIFHGFDDDLMAAVCRNNSEVVHLCLGNNALNDPNRATRILRQAAFSSNHAVFSMIFNHRQDWSADSLMNALEGCWKTSDDCAANAASILDCWDTNSFVWDIDNAYRGTFILNSFLACKREALAERLLSILPNGIPFLNMQDILLRYSCVYYDYQNQVVQTSVLTDTQIKALVAKCAPPSLRELKEYYRLVRYGLSNNKTADNYREIHLNTLNQLLNLAQLAPNEIGEFIVSSLTYNDFDFSESLVAQYERAGQLTPQAKVNILKKLVPSVSDSRPVHQKKCELFTNWANTWKDDISAQAHQLYVYAGTSVSNTGFMENHFQTLLNVNSNDPSGSGLETMHVDDQVISQSFQQLLLKIFPGCDQDPQKTAV